MFSHISPILNSLSKNIPYKAGIGTFVFIKYGPKPSLFKRLTYESLSEGLF